MHDKGNMTQFTKKKKKKKPPQASHEILVQIATTTGQIKYNKLGLLSLSWDTLIPQEVRY